MRISDWSSDVCSSDLGAAIVAVGEVISVFPHVVAEDRRALVGHRIHQRVILIGGRGDLELAGIVGDQPRPARTELARALGVEFFLELIKPRSEEQTSELPSLMRISYAVFCLQK